MKNTYPEHVAFDPKGNWIAAGGTDGSLWMWHMESNKMLTSLDAHSYRITGLDFSSDGQKLITASIDGTFTVWQMPASLEATIEPMLSFGEKRTPEKTAPTTKDACQIAEHEMEKALFYLSERERIHVAERLLGKYVNSDEEVLMIFRCHRNSDGSAWGLIPHHSNTDVNFFRLWLLYVDKNGNRFYGGRHNYWSEGNYGLSIGNHHYFDFNADGIDEVMWTSNHWDKEDYSSDGSDRTLEIKTFKNGSIVDYPQKLDAQSVADVDNDGVLDIIIRPFYSVTMSSCGHSLQASHPVGPTIVAFSTQKGEFSTTGKKARAWYRKECPVNGGITNEVQNGDMIDNERLRHNIACARLWGNSTKQIQAEIKSFCEGRLIEDSCMDEIWFEPQQKGCIGLDHLLDIATATPPLVLKKVKDAHDL